MSLLKNYKYTMKILYKPSFIRQYKKLPDALQQEVMDKVTLFKQDPAHPFLRTHKLKGKMEGYLSFSVNYEYRIIFQYEQDNIALVAVGNHEIYQ